MASAISKSTSGRSGSPFDWARRIALLLPAGLLGGALISEYVGGLYPCEMCYWQRWPHGAAVILALASFAFPARSRQAFGLVAAAAAAIAVSGAIGVYHAGVEEGVFEGFTQCTSFAQGTSTADLLKQITQAPLVRCDQVQWRFLGLSLAAWNAILSLGGAALILVLAVRRRQS